LTHTTILLCFSQAANNALVVDYVKATTESEINIAHGSVILALVDVGLSEGDLDLVHETLLHIRLRFKLKPDGWTARWDITFKILIAALLSSCNRVVELVPDDFYLGDFNPDAEAAKAAAAMPAEIATAVARAEFATARAEDDPVKIAAARAEIATASVLVAADRAKTATLQAEADGVLRAQDAAKRSAEPLEPDLTKAPRLDDPGLPPLPVPDLPVSDAEANLAVPAVIGAELLENLARTIASLKTTINGNTSGRGGVADKLSGRNPLIRSIQGFHEVNGPPNPTDSTTVAELAKINTDYVENKAAFKGVIDSLMRFRGVFDEAFNDAITMYDLLKVDKALVNNTFDGKPYTHPIENYKEIEQRYVSERAEKARLNKIKRDKAAAKKAVAAAAAGDDAEDIEE
jgi:hypothetical protein